MKEAQSRQKRYADKRQKDLKFSIRDQVFVKVSPMKCVIRFGKSGKLALRFIGPFRVVERIGKLAYRVELPIRLSCIHNIFRVLHLHKFIHDPSMILEASQ